MRLKGRDWPEIRKWKRIQQKMGYFPHYHKVGRVSVEVVFVRHWLDRRFWVVQCLLTDKVMYFRKNGHPLPGGSGRLTGPLIEKRKVIYEPLRGPSAGGAHAARRLADCAGRKPGGRILSSVDRNVPHDREGSTRGDET